MMGHVAEPTSEWRTKLGNELRWLRERLGWTHDQVARAVMLNSALGHYIADIEAGARTTLSENYGDLYWLVRQVNALDNAQLFIHAAEGGPGQPDPRAQDAVNRAAEILDAVRN